MAGIIDGERPSRPVHPSFTSELWELIRRCWDQDPHLRPEVSEVLEVLAGLSVPRHLLRNAGHRPHTFRIQGFLFVFQPFATAPLS